MKFLSALVVLCLVAYSTQSPLFDGCNEEIKEFFNEKQCMNVVCTSFKNETVNQSEMHASSCPFPKCEEGKELKDITKGDANAVYPDCCGTPVCE